MTSVYSATSPLFAATLLATAFFVILGVSAGIPAFKIARRNGWGIASVAAPIAFIVCMSAGGLILTVPMAIFVTLLFYLFAWLRTDTRKWARPLYLGIGVVVIVWGVYQFALLRFRIANSHAPILIASNVAGVAATLASAAAFIQSLYKKRPNSNDLILLPPSE